MIKHRSLLKGLLAVLAFTACNTNKQQTATITMQSDFPAPPVAAIKPVTFNEPGGERTDNYYWLKEKENPEVIAYLEAENAYCDTVMKSTLPLQEKLFAEMKGRIKEADETVPQLDNGYYYYSRTEEGKQYRIYCRKKGDLSASEEVVFDVNAMAEGKPAFIFAGFDISTDNKLAAYLSNETGSFADFTLRVRNLDTGMDLPLNIGKVQGFAWANDSKTLFYTLGNEALRAWRVYRLELGSNQPAELVFEEPDEQFIVDISKTKTNDYLLITSASSTTTEVHYLPAAGPAGKFRVFAPRVKDVEYEVYHHKEKFFIRYKDRDNMNFMVYEAPVTGFENRNNWKVFRAHDKDTRIGSLEVFKDYLAMQVRRNGLNEILVYGLRDKSENIIRFPEPVYTAYLSGTPEYDAPALRYSYSSLNRPTSVYDYDFASAQSKLLKQQEIPSGFNPDDYTVERIWATAADGARVPMSVVYKKTLKKDGSNPALLYSYGSYGASSDAYFSSGFYSLIDRGYVFAIAQIRGGSDMGEQWYEDGKLLKKKNTFTDFISCAEKLIEDKFTSSAKLAIMGGSAGGLLVGAVTNMRPDLFNTVVAQVPFVDVVTTMFDTSLPLTTQEYEEWGNPNEEEYYRYMLSYSPYDNIAAQHYPNMLITAGLNDSQVLYHEPAKYAAKLRAMKTGNNLLLLKTNMESGHGGATGRFDALKETAFEMAFILDRVGIRE
ncbi:Dipeptidyl aminopeptidase BI [bioreactor metagenome]|uniref:Dipeptidyl aminopeptidase BI n=1 Tax=bioreactor metagenome TaxID=1076179 RepID=A0A644UWI8_9ZZZZ|nr:S9 family peptidase [Lentimicrobium sp.]MEA5110674.1 S9 family peptidase [Lentimicrobium sp.]